MSIAGEKYQQPLETAGAIAVTEIACSDALFHHLY